jgi:hypothetical protein
MPRKCSEEPVPPAPQNQLLLYPQAMTEDNIRAALLQLNLQMQALVGGPEQLIAYFSDHFHRTFALPPPLPQGVMDFLEYEVEISRLTHEIETATAEFMATSMELESYKAGKNGVVSTERTDNLELMLASKRYNAERPRLALHALLANTTPIDGMKFQVEMQQCLEHKLYLLKCLRKHQIETIKQRQARRHQL